MKKELYTLKSTLPSDHENVVMTEEAFYMTVDLSSMTAMIGFPTKCHEDIFIDVSDIEVKLDKKSYRRITIISDQGMRYDFIKLSSILPSQKNDEDENLPDVLRDAPRFSISELEEEIPDEKILEMISHEDSKWYEESDEILDLVRDLPDPENPDSEKTSTITRDDIDGVLKDAIIIVEMIEDPTKKLVKKFPIKLSRIWDGKGKPPVPEWWTK